MRMQQKAFATFMARRLAGIVIVLVIIASLSYFIFYLLPANPAQLACGKPCTPQNLAAAKAFMGVGSPWYVQLAQFLWGIVAGRTFGSGVAAIHCAAPCFGYSFHLNAPVSDLIAQRLPATVSIAVGAAVLWLIVGVTIGVIAAVFRGSAIDRAAMVVAVAGVSTPTYLVGLLGILLFGFTLGVVPVGGFVPIEQDPVQWLWHLVLPWAVLAFVSAAIYTRVMRSQMLDVLGSDYVRTARAKGLSEPRVIGVHALRNALVPVITLFGLDLGSLLGGAVITEKVFAIPGLGSLLLDAVSALDLPTLVGVTLFSAFTIVAANFVVDIVYGVLDHRVAAQNG